ARNASRLSDCVFYLAGVAGEVGLALGDGPFEFGAEDISMPGCDDEIAKQPAPSLDDQDAPEWLQRIAPALGPADVVPCNCSDVGEGNFPHGDSSPQHLQVGFSDPVAHERDHP